MSEKLPSAAVVSFRAWLRRRAKQRARLKTMSQLSSLPDDMLDDIGISRGDIARAFWIGR